MSEQKGFNYIWFIDRFGFTEHGTSEPNCIGE